MKSIKITPDLIIATGMSISLILAIFMGASAEIIGFIAGGLSGYLGQVVSNDEKKPKKREKGEAEV